MSAALPKGRNEQLDMLRGIAIMLVLFHHVFAAPTYYPGWAIATIAFVRSVGWMGVDLFFVLSGFLVSGLIFSEVQKSNGFKPARFLIRRGFKIYPSYYLMLSVTVLAIPGFFLEANNKKFILYALVFLQNYHLDLLTNCLRATLLHTWSLAVEEHFYFGLTILATILLKYKKGLSWMPAIALCLCLVVPILRIVTCIHPPACLEFTYFATHLRIDALSFGVLLSYAHHYHKERLIKFVLDNANVLTILAVICLAPCITCGCHGAFTYTFGLTMLYIGFGILMMILIYKPWSSKFTKALAYVGFHSYSIYVWYMLNLLTVEIAGRTMNIPYEVKVLLYFSLCITFGILLSKAVEIPCLALRNKLFPAQYSQ